MFVYERIDKRAVFIDIYLKNNLQISKKFIIFV